MTENDSRPKRRTASRRETGSMPRKSKSNRARRKTAQTRAEPAADTALAVPEAEVEYTRAEAGPDVEAFEVSLRRQLIRELDELTRRLRAITPDYGAAPAAAGGVIDVIEESADTIAPGLARRLRGTLSRFINEDFLDVDTWKGMWYVLNQTVQYQTDVFRRRLTGEYETDEWGLDREFMDAVRPFFEFMYRKYWRVQMSGVENIPAEGRALLVVNHSGQLPWDGAMLGTGVMLEHPNQRLVRNLYATWFPTLPFLSDILVKMGQVMATEDNGIRLLEQDELAAVFPEGYKGVGKLFKERYRLARFGRGGFVKMALKARAPMIPVAIVGAEETYISVAKSNVLAKITGFPYFPISVTWPWLGPIGFVPFPTKWYIDIGEPIPMDHYGRDADQSLVLVSQLTDQVRNIVQDMIYARLAKRRSVLFG